MDLKDDGEPQETGSLVDTELGGRDKGSGRSGSFQQIKLMLSDCNKMKLKLYNNECDIGERQVSRCASLLNSTLRFVSATRDGDVSIPRGRRILQAFLERRDCKAFIKETCTPASEIRHQQAASFMMNNILGLLKKLRRQSSYEARMVRHIIYAAISSDPHWDGEPGADPDAPTKVEHDKNMKKLVTTLADSFGTYHWSHCSRVMCADV